MLVDGDFNGKMRKLVVTAARNGYFFVLDRVTGEHLVTSKYGRLTNWAEGLNKFGGPYARPGEGCDRRRLAGLADLRRHHQLAAAGLLARHRLVLCRRRSNGYSIFYLTDIDPRGSMGLGGKEEVNVGTGGSFLTAIDYRTGKSPGGTRTTAKAAAAGLLTTAGKLLFAADGGGQPGGARCRHRQAALEHPHRTRSPIAPQTFMLDGHQYVIAATGEELWAFLLY